MALPLVRQLGVELDFRVQTCPAWTNKSLDSPISLRFCCDQFQGALQISTPRFLELIIHVCRIRRKSQIPKLLTLEGTPVQWWQDTILIPDTPQRIDILEGNHIVHRTL